MLRTLFYCTVVAIFGLIVEISSVLGGESLAWQNDFAKAEELSMKHGRPLLIYVTTANCPFCRKMERLTWPDDAVNERLQTRFVPLRLDADKYPELAAQLGVKGFPTTLIYGTDRKLLADFVGYAPPDRVLQSLDQLLQSGRAVEQR
jgi:thioredoxin-related protein